MIALRQYVKVADHQLLIQLPKDFNYEEVEVVIMPKSNQAETEALEPLSMGKIGFNSHSFVDDDEDYSQW